MVTAGLALLRPVVTAAEFSKQHQETIEFIDRHLKEGVDYGRIQGGKKKPLWKPGAEKLTKFFGLVEDFITLAEEADPDRVVSFDLEAWEEAEKPDEETIAEMVAAGTGRFRNVSGDRDSPRWIWQELVTETGTARGLYRLKLKCVLKLPDGTVVGEGIGSCSTMESEYIRNPREHENTICKMAYKRAHVDGILRTLGISDRFTQDEELIAARLDDAPAPVTIEPSTPAAAAQKAAAAAVIDVAVARQHQRAAAAAADPKERESKLSLIASIAKRFEQLGIDDEGQRVAEAEKILGHRWRTLEDLRKLNTVLGERLGPAPAGAPNDNEKWALALLDEIDACVDGDQLDRLIKNTRDRLDEIRTTDAVLSVALEAYSLRTGSRFAGNTLTLEPDEKDALDWLTEIRNRGAHQA